MTDRYHAIAVVLDRDIRDDDAEFILNAIRMIKGVSMVTGNIVDIDTYSARSKERIAVIEKLQEFIQQLAKF